MQIRLGFCMSFPFLIVLLIIYEDGSLQVGIERGFVLLMSYVGLTGKASRQTHARRALRLVPDNLLHSPSPSSRCHLEIPYL